MASLTFELPESIAAKIDEAVEAGWFSSQAAAVEAAVRDFVEHGKLALTEEQQLEDIRWAVDLAKPLSKPTE